VQHRKNTSIRFSCFRWPQAYSIRCACFVHQPEMVLGTGADLGLGLPGLQHGSGPRRIGNMLMNLCKISRPMQHSPCPGPIWSGLLVKTVQNDRYLLIPRRWNRLPILFVFYSLNCSWIVIHLIPRPHDSPAVLPRLRQSPRRHRRAQIGAPRSSRVRSYLVVIKGDGNHVCLLFLF
jgi:hypothetical protein